MLFNLVGSDLLHVLIAESCVCEFDHISHGDCCHATNYAHAQFNMSNLTIYVFISRQTFMFNAIFRFSPDFS